MLRHRCLLLVSTQILANSLQHDHPSHLVVTLSPGPRSMKQTLFSKNHNAISQHLNDCIVLASTYKKVISNLHTSAVSKALCASIPNNVLGEHSPSINPIEETIVCSHPTTLTQLRSGECHCLKSYLHAINKVDDDLCPECGTESHSIRHLFDCPSFPTDLKVKNLWTRPCEAATFFFDFLSFAN
jgi:hypothetical protein